MTKKRFSVEQITRLERKRLATQQSSANTSETSPQKSETLWKTAKPRLISFALMTLPVALFLFRDRETMEIVLTVGVAGLAVNLASALLWTPIKRHKLIALMVPIALGSAFAIGALHAVRELRAEITETEIQNVGAGVRVVFDFRSLRGEPWLVLYGMDAGRPYLGRLSDLGSGRWQGDVKLGRTDPQGAAQDCQFPYRLEVIQVASNDRERVVKLFDKQQREGQVPGIELSQLPTISRVGLTRFKRACNDPNVFPIK